MVHFHLFSFVFAEPSAEHFKSNHHLPRKSKSRTLFHRGQSEIAVCSCSRPVIQNTWWGMCCIYGICKEVRFDVRVGTTKDIDGVLSQWIMVCVKQGIYSPIDQDQEGIPRKKHWIQNSQCNCDAMFYMVLDNVLNSWQMVSFVEQHNHEMVSPSKRRYLQVNKDITSLSRSLF